MSDPVTLVLVHGCGTSGRFWDELLPHLEGVPVLAPSLPGRAGSGEDPVETAEAGAAWLFERLSDCAIERAVVVGHSFGGAVAIEAALRGSAAGATVCGLGLVATGARLRVMPAILEAVTTAAETGVPAELGRFAYHPSSGAALIERLESIARKTPPATTRQDWMATNAFDRLGQLGSIDVPTLVIGGTADMLTPPKYARYLAENIAGARLVLLEDAGHMFPAERPAELAAALRQLVAAAVAAGD